AGGHSNVLPAASGIGDDAAAHWSTGIESIEHLAAVGAKDHEVASQLAGQNEIPSGRRDGGHHWPWRPVLPLHRAARRIDRRQPALRSRGRIEIGSATHVVLAGNVAELLECR